MFRSCLHFVGFVGDEYTRAVKVFGEPDFVHRWNDGRCREMIVDGDVAVYANGAEAPRKSPYNFDDSEVM